MNRGRTGQASKAVREGARLMWVPVTRYAPLRDIRRWASKPARENIIRLKNFWTMTDPATISNIIADMCPKVNQTDCWSLLACPSGYKKGGDGSSCGDSSGKVCDLGYCDGKPNIGVESCSTGPKTKENLIGNSLGDKCWNLFPCPAGMTRIGDGSACESTDSSGNVKRCDLGYCNNSGGNPGMEQCTTGPDMPTTTAPR